MRILVTGAFGFVGRHLRSELQQAGHEVLGLDVHVEQGEEAGTAFEGDLLDAAFVQRVIEHTQPEACIHLAGMAFVPAAWKDPAAAFRINTEATMGLLQHLHEQAASCRTLVISSAEIYGREPRAKALTEDCRPHPGNIYAISKLAADLGALALSEHRGQPIMTARPSNHIGPGQSPSFVTSAFARQVIDIKHGRSEPLMRVGNLDSQRDFSDVRDICRAYRLLIEQGISGRAYNLGGTHNMPVRKILETLCELGGVHPDVETDPALFRAADHRPLLDCSRAQQDLGWSPQIPLEQSLKDILEYEEARPHS